MNIYACKEYIPIIANSDPVARIAFLAEPLGIPLIFLVLFG